MRRSIDLELVGKLIAFLALLFTVLSFIYNNYAQQKRSAYQETTRLIELFGESDRTKARRQLDAQYLYYSSQLDVNDHEAVPDRLFSLIGDEVLFGVVDGSKTKPPMFQHLLETLDIFQRVDFCVEVKACDPRIATAYFCEKAKSFNNRYERLISYLSEYMQQDLGAQNVQKLAKSC